MYLAALARGFVVLVTLSLFGEATGLFEQLAGRCEDDACDDGVDCGPLCSRCDPRVTIVVPPLLFPALVAEPLSKEDVWTQPQAPLSPTPDDIWHVPRLT